MIATARMKTVQTSKGSDTDSGWSISNREWTATEPFSEPAGRRAEIAPELRYEMTLVTETSFGRNRSKRQTRIPHQFAGSLQPEASNEIPNGAAKASMELAGDVHRMDIGSVGELGQRHTLDKRVMDALVQEPQPRRSPAAGGDVTPAGVAEEITHDRVERAIGAAVAFVEFLNQAAPENGNQFTVKAASGGDAAGLIGDAGHELWRQFNLETRRRGGYGVRVAVSCRKQSNITGNTYVIEPADRFSESTRCDHCQQRELVRM